MTNSIKRSDSTDSLLKAVLELGAEEAAAQVVQPAAPTAQAPVGLLTRIPTTVSLFQNPNGPEDQPMIAGSVTVTPSESRSWTVSLWNTKTKGNVLGFGFLKILVGILFALGDIFINLPYQAYSSWKSSKAAVKQIALNSAPVAQPTITLQPVPAPTASVNTSVPVIQMKAPVADSEEILMDGGYAYFQDAIQADLLAHPEPVQQAPVAQTTPALDKLMKAMRQGATLAHELERNYPAPKVTEEEVDVGAFFASATRSAPQQKKIFSSEAVRAAYPSNAEKRAAKAEAAKAKAEAARIAAEPARINKLFKTIRSKEAGMYAQLGQVQQKMRNDYLDRHELDSRLAKNLSSIRDAGKNTKTTDPIIDRFNRECEVEGEKLAAFAAGPKPITQKVGNETLTVRGETENSVNILTAVANLKKRLNSVLFEASYTTREGVDVEANVRAFNLILKTADKNALQKSFLTSVTREMQEDREQGLDFLASILNAMAKIDTAIELDVVAKGAKVQFLADNYTESVAPALRKEFQDDVAQIGFDAAVANLGQKIDQIFELDTNPDLTDTYIYQKIFESPNSISNLIEGERQKSEVGYHSSVINALNQIRTANRLTGLDGELGNQILSSYIQMIDYRNKFLPEARKEFAKDCESGTDILKAISKFYRAISSSNQVSPNDILPLLKDDIRAALINEFQKRANPPGLVSAGPDLAFYAGKQLIEAVNGFGFEEGVRKTLEEAVQTAIYYPMVDLAALLIIKSSNDFSLDNLDYIEFFREGYVGEHVLNPAHAVDFCHDVLELLNNEQARQTLVAEQQAREAAEAARVAAEQQANEAAQAAQNAAIQQALFARTDLETQANALENNLEQIFNTQMERSSSLVQARQLLDKINEEIDLNTQQHNELTKPLTAADGTTHSFAEWHALSNGTPEAALTIVTQLDSAFTALKTRKNEVSQQVVSIAAEIVEGANLYASNLTAQEKLVRNSPTLLSGARDSHNHKSVALSRVLAFASECLTLVSPLQMAQNNNGQASPQASLIQPDQSYGNVALTSLMSSQPASPVPTGRTSPLSLTIVPSREIASERESIREDETLPVSPKVLFEDGEEGLLEDLVIQEDETVFYRPDAGFVFAGTPPGSPK